MVHKSSTVAPGCFLGPRVVIGPNCTVKTVRDGYRRLQAVTGGFTLSFRRLQAVTARVQND